jgi:hypothetical protein
MNTIRLEIWAPASRQPLFDAVTTRQGLDQWWGRCVRAEPEFDHGLGDLLRMRVIELVDDSRVVWRCVSDFVDPANPASEWLGTSLSVDLRSGREDPAFDWMASRVGFDAGGDGDVTILEFTHTDWPNSARWLSFCDQAWGATPAALAQHVASASAA